MIRTSDANTSAINAEQYKAGTEAATGVIAAAAGAAFTSVARSVGANLPHSASYARIPRRIVNNSNNFFAQWLDNNFSPDYACRIYRDLNFPFLWNTFFKRKISSATSYMLHKNTVQNCSRFGAGVLKF